MLAEQTFRHEPGRIFSATQVLFKQKGVRSTAQGRRGANEDHHLTGRWPRTQAQHRIERANSRQFQQAQDSQWQIPSMKPLFILSLDLPNK